MLRVVLGCERIHVFAARPQALLYGPYTDLSKGWSSWDVSGGIVKITTASAFALSMASNEM